MGHLKKLSLSLMATVSILVTSNIAAADDYRDDKIKSEEQYNYTIVSNTNAIAGQTDCAQEVLKKVIQSSSFNDIEVNEIDFKTFMGKWASSYGKNEKIEAAPFNYSAVDHDGNTFSGVIKIHFDYAQESTNLRTGEVSVDPKEAVRIGCRLVRQCYKVLHRPSMTLENVKGNIIHSTLDNSLCED